jgi:mannose-6-phosphate isomerase-like protein (cupin superfamily)
MSTPEPSYQFYDEDKYAEGEVISIPAELASRPGQWFNQKLTVANGVAVRLAVMNGTYHWHQHQDADEFFLVLTGRLAIDLKNASTVWLQQHEAYVVPRGQVHRTRAPERVVAVLVEPATLVPAGD